MKDDIKITFYEPWMKQQIAKLFEIEYKIPANKFEDFMSKLYENSYQVNKCIQIVALDDKKVIGFQSFFYWPYTQNNKIYYSLQSGNSLVHPSYRGKGIFNKLLNYIFQENSDIHADFLIGFPVQASYNSFIKNNWKNILNLQWYIKLINPFAFLFRLSNLNVFQREFFPNKNFSNNFKLDEGHEFLNWKNLIKNNKLDYFYYSTVINNQKFTFELKYQARKKIIKELVIGKVYMEENSYTLFPEALKELIKTCKKIKCITILSIAINEKCQQPNYLYACQKNGFKKIEKKIYFIIKAVKKALEKEIENPEKFDILRADIDTW